MGEEIILAQFARQTPRKVCLKRYSPETGADFNPWGWLKDLGGCGGIIIGIFLLLALIPVLRQDGLIAAAIFGFAIAVLAILASFGSIEDVKSHKRLARFGEAVVGQITRITAVAEEDGTPATPTRVTIEYTFRTNNGHEVSGKRDTISGWYNALLQESEALVKDRRLVIVYLPGTPEKHEPYASLRYRVCD